MRARLNHCFKFVLLLCTHLQSQQKSAQMHKFLSSDTRMQPQPKKQCMYPRCCISTPQHQCQFAGVMSHSAERFPQQTWWGKRGRQDKRPRTANFNGKWKGRTDKAQMCGDAGTSSLICCLTFSKRGGANLGSANVRAPARVRARTRSCGDMWREAIESHPPPSWRSTNTSQQVTSCFFYTFSSACPTSAVVGIQRLLRLLKSLCSIIFITKKEAYSVFNGSFWNSVNIFESISNQILFWIVNLKKSVQAQVVARMNKM